MKTKMYRCSLMLIIILICSSIVFGEELEMFQYTSDVEIHDKEDDFIMLEISPEVYGSMNPGLEDLRLYHEGKELDYLVFPKENQHKTERETPLDIYNKGIIDNLYSFEIMPPKEINIEDIEYIIHLNAPQYFINAKIYGSNDRKEWKYLKDQIVYSINGEYNKFRLDNIQYDVIKIEYPLLYNGETIEVNTAGYTQTEPVINKGDFKVVDFTTSKNEEEKAMEITIDYQYNHYSTKGVVLKTEEKYFYRQVTVRGSNDKENWTEITRTFIFRDGVSEKLEINYSPAEYRYLQMMVYNEDNQPIEIKEIKTETLPIYVLVNVADEPKDFMLKSYWGNPSLAAPKYDIENLNMGMDPQQYEKYRMDAYTENETFIGVRGQLALTERYPWLMPVSLALLTLGALVFLYRTVKQVG
ncbi:hypothetical protein [Anaerosolibacter sp.]|uniref:hypothetical protein n=1 Tax=Anaerosolibacter sp. TaxID=1872527 RepID=UPI0039EF626F